MKKEIRFAALTTSYLIVLRILTILILGASVGSYSDSPGIEIIRRHVADYIAERLVVYFV